MSSAESSTDLDQVILPAIPPVHLLSGQISALQVTDRLQRGGHIVGRFETSGLVGFKVAAHGRPLRVQVSLSTDDMSVSGWHNGITESQGPSLPRFVQVRSQGRLRQCVLLKGRRAHAKVAFELAANEIPDDGLICVEVLDIMEGEGVSEELRQAVSGRVQPDGVAGLRLNKVVFELVPESEFDPDTLDGLRCEFSSLVSAGGLANWNRRQGVRVLRSGLLVVNPVFRDTFGSNGRLTLRLSTKAEAASLLPVTWRRMSSELRWLGHAGRKLCGAAAPVVEQVLGVRDGDMGAPEQRARANVTELTLPDQARWPLLVVLESRRGVIPTLESALVRD
ncbi:hypothetical protein [Nonomuraea jiangxiensis]|uniref:Uncharacterized protein n=1 Tax=Nonomuraea jiangxiensis TaxID=633440 RepID=A0A1G9SYP5_9ACTN|nr:hypothetical protein [Nonomuraea jiangxiensis]SDM40512.1 hypothetical protein SAMN05421869_1432 [Nonomuraea jiangxiensis]